MGLKVKLARLNLLESTLFKFTHIRNMPHTLPEAKRAKADRRRNSKRELKMARSKARNAKYAFVQDFTATTEPVEPQGAEKVSEPESKE